MANKIIVISGKIGSGKDHVASLISGYLARQGKPLYQKVDVLRFADPIKTGIAGMFNLYNDFLLSDENKKQESPFKVLVENVSPPTFQNLTYGSLQQHFGDAMRSIYLNIFADILISKANSIKNVVIVPDLRYGNELKAILDNYKKPLLIKLVGTYKNKSDSRNLNHSSETSIDKLPNEAFNYILNRSVYKDDILSYHIKQILIQENLM